MQILRGREPSLAYGVRYYKTGHAILGDGQMVTGGSVNRVGIGWPGIGERWATAHGWYHED